MRWQIHGADPRSVILLDSIEEGPLAEITCRGDVDPADVADALNDNDTLHRLAERLVAKRDALTGKASCDFARREVCDWVIERLGPGAPS